MGVNHCMTRVVKPIGSCACGLDHKLFELQPNCILDQLHGETQQGATVGGLSPPRTSVRREDTMSNILKKSGLRVILGY